MTVWDLVVLNDRKIFIMSQIVNVHVDRSFTLQDYSPGISHTASPISSKVVTSGFMVNIFMVKPTLVHQLQFGLQSHSTADIPVIQYHKA